MKKKLPPTELANEFLTIVDGLFSNSSLRKEQDLIHIFNRLDDDSKSYIFNHTDILNNSILMDATKNSKENLAITLIELGFDINHYNINGKSVLITAIKNKLYSLIDVLLEKGVDVNYARLEHHSHGNMIGSSALMFAIDDGEYEIVKKLIAKGADINYVNDLGQYPLLYSIKKTEQHFQCFKYLIEQPNIIVNRFDILGNNILERIIKFGTIEFLPLALDKGAYNPEVYSMILDHINRNIGWNQSNTQKKNTREEAMAFIEYTNKYLDAKKLNEELNIKSNSLYKKLKI